jgi:phospholipid-binding lipoprotein MlaA
VPKTPLTLLKIGFIGVITISMAACSTTGAANPDDPYEGFNRSMLNFNGAVDRAVIGPIARGYGAITPAPVQAGVSNFTANLKEPVTLVNEVLQGNPGDAMDAFFRLAVNTTLGLGGLFNVAGAMGVEREEEDFGQTMAVWGVPSGPYLVLPLMGPSTVRDTFGRVPDAAFDPLNWAEFDNEDTFNWSRRIIGGLNARYAFEGRFSAMFEGQDDPYAVLKQVHLRNRAAAIADAEVSQQGQPQDER